MQIRECGVNDGDAVVRLSLRAWAPVFDSMARILDPPVFDAFYPNGWEAHQSQAVASVLADPDLQVWVADLDGAPVGFVAVRLHGDDRLGEIHMVAVDPDHQGAGIGRALTEYAIAWIREQGMTLAMVETGSDPGHAPARRTYERSGFKAFPVTRYFMKL